MHEVNVRECGRGLIAAFAGKLSTVRRSLVDFLSWILFAHDFEIIFHQSSARERWKRTVSAIISDCRFDGAKMPMVTLGIRTRAATVHIDTTVVFPIRRDIEMAAFVVHLGHPSLAAIAGRNL